MRHSPPSRRTRTTLLLAGGLFVSSLLGASGERNAPGAQSAADRKNARDACLAMIKGWYSGSPEPLQHVLHERLAKRGVLIDPETGDTRLSDIDKETFLKAVRTGMGTLPEAEWQIEAEVIDTSAHTATVKVTSQYLVDICQVARIDGRWQIVNVLWYVRKTPPWFESGS